MTGTWRWADRHGAEFELHLEDIGEDEAEGVACVTLPNGAVFGAPFGREGDVYGKGSVRRDRAQTRDGA